MFSVTAEWYVSLAFDNFIKIGKYLRIFICLFCLFEKKKKKKKKKKFYCYF